MLTTGTKLGTYEVTSHIGSGGMGEVYQAQDTKLGRSVAIKVLPEAFAHDPDRLARFQREAKTLAALNHPNIATIHGLEEANGTHYLVMELVPGETLADRIRREGAVPVEEALAIARQIAEALETAHEKGIIHRDLKPANVKVTPEGKVKVLDFGLAKAFAGDGATDNVGNSPTLSMAATQQGVILGTAAYMSPEQARGKTVDKRTDIWAFGCVLYEMITGQKAFPGEDVGDILAAVVRAEPDWSRLPDATPATIRTLLRRCLRKDWHQRLADVSDARIEIEDVLSGAVPASVEAVPAARGKGRERLAWAVAVLLAITTIAFAVGFVLRTPQPPQPLHLSAEIGVDASLFTEIGPAAILSPDGSRLAFVAIGADGRQRIYLRSLDRLEATPLSGTEGARNPFFSPDGQWLGFFADGKLKKVAVQGGAAVTLWDAPNDRGGSWGEDGTIVFASGTTFPLSKVSSAGGTPEPLTTLDEPSGENTQRWPQVLPGGEAVLFTSSSLGGSVAGFEDADIVVYSMVSGERKTVQRGGFYARYLPSGHVVYMHEGTLFAVPYDLEQLEVTGQPAPVLEGVLSSPVYAGAQFSVSDTGNLMYVAGQGDVGSYTLAWIDRGGREEPIAAAPAANGEFTLSPDGTRVAVRMSAGGNEDVWIYDLVRDTSTRLTFESDNVGAVFPTWTPDGTRVAFGPPLSWKRADGIGAVEELDEATGRNPQTFTPDGGTLVFEDRAGAQGGFGLGVLTLEGDRTASLVIDSEFAERNAALSPDGRWLAYQSNETGQDQVYVRPFPDVDSGRWQVSTEGGEWPVWNPAGNELFYRSRTGVMALAFETEPTFTPGALSQVFEWTFTGGTFRRMAVSPDGRRFLLLANAPEDAGSEATRSQLVVVQNWFEELKRLAPGGTK